MVGTYSLFFFLSFFFVEDGGVKGCLEEGDHMLALVRTQKLDGCIKY